MVAPNRFYQTPHATGMGWRMPRSAAALRAVRAEGIAATYAAEAWAALAERKEGALLFQRFARFKENEEIEAWFVAQEGDVAAMVAVVLGVMGMGTYSVYSASKAAVNYMTKSTAIELAPHNIAVNAILPGNTATPGAVRCKLPKTPCKIAI